MFITTKFITVTKRKQQSGFQKKITKEKVVYTGVISEEKGTEILCVTNTNYSTQKEIN